MPAPRPAGNADSLIDDIPRNMLLFGSYYCCRLLGLLTVMVVEAVFNTGDVVHFAL